MKKAKFAEFLQKLNIKAELLDKNEIGSYKEEWVNSFSPSDANLKEIKKHCLDSRKYRTYLWHMFSYDYLECEEGKEAGDLFDKQMKKSCVIVSNAFEVAYRIENCENLIAQLLEEFIDVTITASDFSWTYTKTHEEYCGPYFYKKIKK